MTPLAPPPDRDRARVGIWSALAVLLLAVAVMSPSIGHGFLNWDDQILLHETPAVAAPDGLLEIWTTREFRPGYPTYPVTMTTYWLEHALWGFAPAGYHAVNVLLHGAAAVMVLLVLHGLGLRPRLALLGAAIFAVHPVQVETVAWVAERKNVLFTLLCLASLLAYLRFHETRRWAWYAAMVAAFVLGVLAKTSAVTLPVTLVATAWLRDGRLRPERLLELAPLFAISLAAGLWVLGIEHAPRDWVHWSLRPLLASNAIAFYLVKFTLPLGLSPIYPRWDVGLHGAFVAAPLLLAAGLAAALRWRRSIPPVVAWGAAHFLASVALFTGLVGYGYLTVTFVADRYLYFAGVGLLVPLVLVLDAIGRRLPRPAALAGAAAILVAGAALSVRQIGVWRDPETFWTAVLERVPECATAHNNYGLLLREQGRLADAVPHFALAAELQPTLVEALGNCGMGWATLGDERRAEACFRQALATSPGYWPARAHLAWLLLGQGRNEQAIVHCRAALRLDPHDRAAVADLYAMLGVARDRLGREDEADDAFRRALEVHPAHPIARAGLARHETAGAPVAAEAAPDWPD